MADLDRLPTTLLDLLANTLVLRQLSPYIPSKSLLALSATCKDIQDIIISQSEPWRHLDLTGITSAMIDSSPIDSGGISWRAFYNDQKLFDAQQWPAANRI